MSPLDICPSKGTAVYALIVTSVMTMTLWQ